MSRYILAPSTTLHGDKENEQFLLIPTEGINEQIKSIDLPRGLVPNLFKGKKVKHGKIVENLVMKLSKAEIGRSKDGLVTVGSKVLDTKFDDFVLNSSNGKFLECYEDIYCLLRKNGITF